MWMLENGQRAREGIRDAAEAFWGTFDRWPVAVLVNPGDAEKWPVISDQLSVDSPIAEAMGYGALRMRSAGWVPRGGVVVVGG